MSEMGSTRAPFNRTVQCRCGPVARPVAPTAPRIRAALDPIALVHVDPRQVREKRMKAGPVIEDDRVAGEIEIGGEHPRAPRSAPAIGVPSGLEKSAPPCGARGALLKTLRTPNPDTSAPSMGTTKGPFHSGDGVTERRRAQASQRSRAMRASALFGRRDEARVHPKRARGKRFVSTLSISTCAISLPAAVRAVMATGPSPAATSRSIPTSAATRRRRRGTPVLHARTP
jgi:hypothetical protein